MCAWRWARAARDVIGLVMMETFGPVLAGVAAAWLAALAFNHLFASLLYQVAPSDPAVLASVAAATGLAALRPAGSRSERALGGRPGGCAAFALIALQRYSHRTRRFLCSK